MKSKGKSCLPCLLVLAGAGTLGYVGVRKLLNLEAGADANFFHWTGATVKGVDVGSAQIDLPIMYYRDDSFLGAFSAAYGPVRALLPSKELYPVTLPGGRAMVVVAAFNYMETSIGPYGEVGITIPCTYERQALPLLPLVLEEGFPGWGFFVLHLPVTSLIARDGGRAIYGYAKFVADMDFQKRPTYQRVCLTEGDARILTLTVQQQGLPIRDNRAIITYSVLNGELIKTVVPSRSVYQVGLRPGLGTLELGDHEIAGQLRSLDISTTAVVTRNVLTRCSILPAGEPIGLADCPHPGYAGRDQEFGRLTVSYDDASEAIDLYARMT